MKKNSITTRLASLGLALLLSLPFGTWAQDAGTGGTSPPPVGQAQVLTGQVTLEAEYSVIFEGAVDSALLTHLLPLLKEHGVRAGFFVPAITLAEEPALAQHILNNGHWLGNYLLHGERLTKDGPMDKQERSIMRAQEILKKASGEDALFLKGKATAYTDELLHLIAAQGLPYVLEPNVFLNHTSFKEASQAEDFVMKLENGSIISFKIRLPIEAAEMPERDALPTDILTPEATPGPKVGAVPMPTYQVEDRLLEVIGWVLSAIQARGMTPVTPETLILRQQSAYSGILRSVMTETESRDLAESIRPDSPKAAVLTSGTTLSQAVSLVLEGEASQQTLERILSLFQERGMKATFFLPALAAARQADTVQSIQKQGHELGNYLLGGEKHPELLEQAQQVRSLHRAQMVLNDLGIFPSYFKANLGKPDERLLQSVAVVGMKRVAVPTLYVNHTSFTTPQQAAGFVGRLQPGSLISIKMNQVLDATEVAPSMGEAILPTATPQASQQPVSDQSDPAQEKIRTEQVEKRLLEVVDWLTAALNTQGTKTLSLDELVEQQQDPRAQLLFDIQNEQESKAIASSLHADSPKADVLRSGVDFSGTRKVSILFEGRISKQGLLRIGEALRTYQVPSVFFIPGTDLLSLQAELQSLKHQGHQLGNYLMKGERNADSLSQKAQVQSLYRAQHMAQTLFGEAPTLLRANDSLPSGNLLQAAAAVGIKALVQPLAYLNHTSFTTREQAQRYAKDTLPGAILTFKMNDFISKEEARLPEPTPTSSLIALPTQAPATPEPMEVEERLIQSVLWLLEALNEYGFEFQSPQDITKDLVLPYPEGTKNGRGWAIGRLASSQPMGTFQNNDSQPFRNAVGKDLPEDGQMTIPSDLQAGVITSSPVQEKEVSLVFEALQDVAAVQRIALVLDHYGVTATFYVPAMMVEKNPELASSLTASGHQLGNYLFGGETAAHQLQPEWLRESILRAQASLQQATGQAPDTFKGNLTSYTPELLAQLKNAGISFAVKPGAVLNQTSFKTSQQAERYAARTAPGTLIGFKVDQVIDQSELPLQTPTVKPAGTSAVATPAPENSAIEIPLLSPSPKPEAAQAAAPEVAELVQWLIEGYLKAGFAFVSPKELYDAQQSEYGQLMRIVAKEELDQKVLTQYRTTFQGVPVLGSEPVLEKEISLVFEGWAEEQTLDALLTLLEKYQAKALFFLPAKQAATQPLLVERMIKAGHRIGNYGLEGEKQLENLSEEALLRSVYHAQIILTNLMKQEPELFKGNVTAYSQQVQRVVAALALKGSVYPSLFLNHSSFRNQAQANAFVEKTQWGSILSLKMNQVLDNSEIPVSTPKPQGTPSPQHTPETPMATPLVVPTVMPQTEVMAAGLSNEEKLLKITEWLLAGYNKRGFAFVTPETIAKDANAVLKDLLQAELTSSGREATLVSQAPTTDKEVSLLLRLPPDRDRAAELIQTLLKVNLKAILAVTGDDIVTHQDSLRQLADKGHYIISAGFTGGSVTQMDYREAYLEMKTNALLMQEKLGFTTPFYAPLAGQVGQNTLMAANDLGLIPLAYQIRTKPGPSDTVQDVLEGPFKWGVRRGDIVFADLSEAKDMAGILTAIQWLVEDTGYKLVTADILLDNTYALQDLHNIPGFDNLKVNPNYDERASLTGRMLSQIPVKEKVVFLAIDDWGSDKTITTMLDILKAHDVVGNFFVINTRAAKHPNLLRAIDQDGHVIGSHGYDHELLTKTDLEELQQLLVRGYQEMTVALGRAPDLVFQPPQLEMNRAAGNAVLATGFKAIIGSRVSTHDYKRTARQVLQFVRSNLQKGAVILIHSSDVASANEALPGIIAYVRSQGYEFARIPDYLPNINQVGKEIKK